MICLFVCFFFCVKAFAMLQLHNYSHAKKAYVVVVVVKKEAVPERLIGKLGEEMIELLGVS